jgi:hypothetical protein
VSNRRRLTRPVPPPAVAALAAAYECGHCDADIGRPYRAAARVRKARRNGSCPICPRPIAVGQNVGLIAAGWAHLPPCIVQRRQLAGVATTTEPEGGS